MSQRYWTVHNRRTTKSRKSSNQLLSNPRTGWCRWPCWRKTLTVKAWPQAGKNNKSTSKSRWATTRIRFTWMTCRRKRSCCQTTKTTRRRSLNRKDRQDRPGWGSRLRAMIDWWFGHLINHEVWIESNTQIYLREWMDWLIFYYNYFYWLS